jgi:septal ring factor EnvC (AmiA/AmiB activator)
MKRTDQLATLQTERERIARQLAQLVNCEETIKRESPAAVLPLAQVIFRAEALRQYLAQLDQDIEALIEVPIGV